MTTTNIQSFFGNVEVEGTLDVTGTLTSTTGVNNVSLAVDTTDASLPIIFSTGTEGSQSLKTDPGITYNPSTNVLAVTSNIGIGTTAPAYNLDVHGTANVGALTATTGTFSSNFAVNTNDLFVNTGTGRVGVGTTSPSSKLHVFGGGLSADTDLATFHYINGNQSYLKIRQVKHTPAYTNWEAWSTRIQQVTDVTNQSYIEFNPVGGTYATAFGRSTTEYMRITGDGNIGIGTSSPAYTLDVHGTSNVGALTATSATVPNDGDFVMSGKPLQPTAGLHWDKINSRLGVGMTSPQFAVDVDGIINAKGLYLDGSAYTVSPWKLNANGNDVYYTTGNVGVGTTSPTSNLHVVGNAYVTSNLTVGASNLFVDTTNGMVGVGTTNPSVKLELFKQFVAQGLYDTATLKFSTTNGSNNWDVGSVRGAVALNNGGTSNYPGGLVFATKVPGSASGALVDRMVIDANGNVGIGTTSPAYKLDVHGSANVGALTVTSVSGLEATDIPNLDADKITSGTLTRPISTTDIKATSFVTGRVILAETWPNASLVGDLGTWVNSSWSIENYTNTSPDGYRVISFKSTGILTSPTFDVRKYALVDDASAGDVETKTSTRLFLKCWLYSDSLDEEDAEPFFYIEFSPNNGTTWYEVYRDNSNEDSGTDAGYKMAVADLSPYIDATNSTNAKIRFRGTSPGSADYYRVGRILIYESDVPTNLGGMWLGAGGNIGIGTTSPGSTLDVVGTAAISSNLEVGTANLFVDTVNSRVGVGTTSPIAALDIVGGAEDDTTPALSIRGGIYDTSDLYVLNTYSAATGIGYAAKVIGVNIKNKVETNNTIQVRNNTGGLTAAGAIYLGTDDLNQGIFGVLGADGVAGTTLTERLTVRAGGNVGIGTTSPAYKLEVSGKVAVPNDGDFVMNSKPLTSASGLHWDTVNLRLGVGVSSPGVRLDIAATSDYVPAIRIGTNTTYDDGQLYSLRFGGNDRMGMGLYSSTRTVFGSQGLCIHIPNTEEYSIRTNSWAKLFALDGATQKAYFGGDVGIGTTSPAQKLDVAGRIRCDTMEMDSYIYHVDDADTYFGFDDNDHFRIVEGGGTRFQVDSTGNVGIGTDAPDYTLDVHGSANVGALTVTSVSGLEATDIPNLDADKITSGTLNKDILPTTLNNTTIGNLAVGTNDITITGKVDYHGLKIIKAFDSPDEPATLLLAGDGDPGDDIAFEIRGNETGSTVDTTTTRNSDDTTFGILHTGHTYIGYANLNPNETDGKAQTGDPMLNVNGDLDVVGTAAISSNLAVNTDDFFVDTVNSRVGIGTTSPLTQLHVRGTDCRLAIADSSSDDCDTNAFKCGIAFVDNTWDGDSLYASNPTAGMGFLLAHLSSSSKEINMRNLCGPLSFGTRNVIQAMYINDSGNVGIGTTSPAYKLEVNGTVNTGALTATTATVPNDGDFVMGGKPLKPAAGLHWDRTNLRLGVGTTSPAVKLQVDGDFSFGDNSLTAFPGDNFTYDSDTIPHYGLKWRVHSGYTGGSTLHATGYGGIRFFTKGTERVIINNSGNVGIGTASPTYKLHVAGDIYATGDVIMFSDERKKTNIEVIPNALEKVLQLRGVTFEKLDDGNRRHSGIIAQEVEKVLPEVVYTAEDGTKSVAYGNMIGLLIEAIKELAGK